MKMNTIRLALVACAVALGTGAFAQLPKLKVPTKADLPKVNSGTVTDKAGDAGGDVAQKKGSLDATCGLIEQNIAKNAWSEDATVYNIVSSMKRLASDVYKCNESMNPGEKALGKQYQSKFEGYLGTYMSKVDMTKQQMDPPLAEAEQKAAHEAFNNVSYSYRLLKNTDSKPKSSWGDQAFIDELKTNIDKLKSSATAYLGVDKGNFGKVERYTEAVKAYEKLYEERKGLPAKREESVKYLNTKREQYDVMSGAKTKFEDHAKFQKAVETFDWVEVRKHVTFMNEWGFTSSGNYGTLADDLDRWVPKWPGDVKADMNKEIAAAKAEASSAKYAYTQWVAAERVLALTKSAAIIYLDDAAITGAVAGAQTLRDDRFKKYDATFSSDYHRQNTFSIGVSTTGAVGFKPLAGFKAGDKVVFTVFLDRPVELLAEEGHLWFTLDKIWSNEEDLGFSVEAADIGKSYVDIVLFSEKPYKEATHEAEEEILRELCMAEGKSVSANLHCKLSANVADKGMKDLKFTFDGTNAAGIGTYRTRWISLNAKRLATVTMPKAVTSNGTLEADFGKAFMAHYPSGDDVKSVILTRLAVADWSVVRNELTGIIIAHDHAAFVAYKRVDGTCRVEKAAFEQEAQGGGKYGPTYYDGNFDNFEIHCANVK